MMGMRTSMLRIGQTIGAVGVTFTADTFFNTTLQGYRSLMLLAGLVVLGSTALIYTVSEH